MKSKPLRVAKTNKSKLMLLSRRGLCNSKKSRFVKNEELV